MFAHWQFRSALLNFLCLTAVAAAQAVLQDVAPPTYRTDVSEVRVTFFATNEQEQPITDLVSSDLAVVDGEKILRNFRSFRRATENKLDIVILLDASQSVDGRFQFATDEIARIVASEQFISQDNISVIVFGEGAHSGTAGLAAPASLHPALLCTNGCRLWNGSRQAIESGGVTPLFDALLFAADFLAQHRRPGARPVLILFSDGNDTISLHSSHDALQALADAGALVYSIDLGDSSHTSDGTRFLQQLSNATGGRYLFLEANRQNNTPDLLETVLGDLRASYIVTYALPSHLAGFHEIRLLPTRNLNLTFHSRSGYYYETNSQ